MRRNRHYPSVLLGFTDLQHHVRAGSPDLDPLGRPGAPFAKLFAKDRTMHRTLACLLATLTALPLQAATCGIDRAAMEDRIADLEPTYGLILSDISCDLPTLPAHRLMCETAEGPNPELWRMGRLDDLAWVYAVENATGQELDLTDPPRDDSFLAARDACTDEACLCDVLIQHTNDSLGGTSPYPQ
jgi:hypothetical protein